MLYYSEILVQFAKFILHTARVLTAATVILLLSTLFKQSAQYIQLICHYLLEVLVPSVELASMNVIIIIFKLLFNRFL